MDWLLPGSENQFDLSKKQILINTSGYTESMILQTNLLSLYLLLYKKIKVWLLRVQVNHETYSVIIELVYI